MKKDAFYFSHDANAQDDPKCMVLIDQLGMEGYGIFWALIEKLRSEKGYKLPLETLPAFAKRWGTSKEKVETVVKNYNLFKISHNYFFSLRLKQSMEEKTDRARRSLSHRYPNSTVLQPYTTESQTNTKKRKEIEREREKKKDSFPPDGGRGLRE